MGAEKGRTSILKVEAGGAIHPRTEFVRPGLPFGPKPRLILAYLNAEALRTGSPEIEVEDSLTAFVSGCGLIPTGRTSAHQGPALPALRRQIRLAVATARRATGKFADRQRLSISGFRRTTGSASCGLPRSPFPRLLREPATPRRALRRAAIAALSHSAMGLDIYAWLAQRLHRVTRKARLHPVDGAQGAVRLALWPDGQVQAGFRQTLDMVLSQYRALARAGRPGHDAAQQPTPGEGPDGLISKA